MEYYTLNGRKIQAIAFGTYQSEGNDCYCSVRKAIDVGYTNIDTASFYKNENLVGKAIKDSGLDREKLFVTTKIWNSEQGTVLSKKSIENSLKNLDLGYIDLMLIHWPIPVGHEHDYQTLNKQTFEVMAEYREKGLIKHLGVSNFLVNHLKEIEQNTGIRPEINQIEMHPGLMQEEICSYCKDNDILVQAWRPLMKGNCNAFPTLVNIAKKHGKTSTQVSLRAVLQAGAMPIPKSVHAERIEENFDIFDFSLSLEEMNEIYNMDEFRCGSHPLHLTRT
ncbi:MAG: aldo/keto reductase [Clostridiales bacterium]|nr:aldo/keto reductase [Clostridiales bacterium]